MRSASPIKGLISGGLRLGSLGALPNRASSQIQTARAFATKDKDAGRCSVRLRRSKAKTRSPEDYNLRPPNKSSVGVYLKEIAIPLVAVTAEWSKLYSRFCFKYRAQLKRKTCQPNDRTYPVTIG